MNIINATPHELNIYDEDKNLVSSIPASGKVTRLSTSRQIIAREWGIPFFNTAIGEVQDLPEPQEDTIFVVSGFVHQAFPERTDLWQPGEPVRDDSGRVIGCVGLSQ